jgi:phosphoribosylformylglycinamidine cyclo-ligase
VTRGGRILSLPLRGDEAYRCAGVDRAEAARAVDLIRGLAAGATRPEIVSGVGGFAGLVELGDGRLLAAGADGVGTKTEIARLAGRLDTVGIDVVAMCVNDVLCAGAEPLFFLDYLAVGRLVPEDVASIVAGVAEGCRRAGCGLLGGETAEHPGLAEEGRFDLAGFCVGIVNRDELLGPHRVRPGDVLIGLPSSGLHSNGFSLVRAALVQDERSLDVLVPELGRSLADELLEPTRMYVAEVRELQRAGLIHSAAHITGGGLVENVPRALPVSLGAVIDTSAWSPRPIFSFVARATGLPAGELYGVLNMGIGMVTVTTSDSEGESLEVLRRMGSDPVILGRVTDRPEIQIR